MLQAATQQGLLRNVVHNIDIDVIFIHAFYFKIANTLLTNCISQ